MPVTVVSRRTLACGLALLPGLLAVPGGATLAGATSAAAAHSEGLSHSAEAIHQEVSFTASCQRLYAALTDARAFDAVTRLSDGLSLVTARGARAAGRRATTRWCASRWLPQEAAAGWCSTIVAFPRARARAWPTAGACTTGGRWRSFSPQANGPAQRAREDSAWQRAHQDGPAGAADSALPSERNSDSTASASMGFVRWYSKPAARARRLSCS